MRHQSSLLTLAALVALALPAAAAENQDYPFQPVPFTAVRVNDPFWSPRFETNRQTTVWYDFKKCEETGRIDNFAKAAGLMPGNFKGIPFDDSDVYKVIEGAAYILAMQPDPKLDGYLDALIAKIAAAQEPDGYLYTARRLFPPEKMPGMSGPKRFSNLRDSHELYNVGHLFEAAAAHFQATGKRSLLDVALKNADFLDTVFGPGKLGEPPGHEEIEMGLVKLYRVTNNAKYLRLARFFVDTRGRAETHKLRGPGQQDHLPVLEQKEAVGHAVRAGYLYSGMADVAALTGEASYVAAIDRIWEDVLGGKLHLTGGIGARHDGEAFGSRYELPNRSAYLETCAAIANALWNHRMFLLHGEARYLDVYERVIYNGFLSGVAMTGDAFFYPNPLEADGKYKFNHGDKTRQPWFGCSCCPVNVVRFIPAIAGCIYATRADRLYVNLYIGGEARATVAGRLVQIAQETRYPWDGLVKLKVDPAAAGPFSLRLRIPGWAQGRPVPSDLYHYQDLAGVPAPVLKVNGQALPLKLEQGFAVVDRSWNKGDAVELTFPLAVRRVVSHEGVKDNLGRVALERGPVLYCAEQLDNQGRVFNLALPDGASVTAEHRSDLLGGVTVLNAAGLAVSRENDGTVKTGKTSVVMVPYYSWNHRGAGEMAVWLPRTPQQAQVPPQPTVAGLATLSASHAHAQDSLAALNDQVEPRTSNDQSIPRFTWWDHRGTREWVQYDLDKSRKISGASVYWFDDTGRGSCRVPASWRLVCRNGTEWQPVAGNPVYPVVKDAWSTVRFAPVETSSLRLEVELPPTYSGGILEWKLLE
jgi:DUF1680 family protein